MNTITKALALLNSRERFYLLAVMFLTVAQAGLEMATVASVAPFLMVAADPSKIQSVSQLSWLYETLGFASSSSFLTFLASAALIILVTTNASAAGVVYARTRFSVGRTHSISLRLLSRYLHQPYTFFLNRNTSVLGKNVLTEAQQVVAHVITPMLNLLSSSASAISITAVLLYIDWQLTLIALSVLGFCYGCIYWVFRSQLLRLGEEQLLANSKRYKFAGEAFGGIKDVKIMKVEEAMLSMFQRPSRDIAHIRVRAAMIKQIPRLALQVIAFGGIMIIALTVLLSSQGDLATAVPILGVFAYAGFRLLPRLQGIFAAISKIRHGTAVVNEIYRELTGQGETKAPARLPAGAEEPVHLHHAIRLQHVTYTYPAAAEPALRDFSLEIPARTTVGFMGPSGGGKTTLGDLIMGLLHPDRGAIWIDDIELDGVRRHAWMNSIGYVPQSIYLLDDSVTRNIAFGVPRSKIDHDAVRWAARIANIDDFVHGELPQGYATSIGERGIRLSGGQRQRIGIARALYRNPDVLLLDEATAALDTATEGSVMAAINGLAGTRTIIIIAHRISTLAGCSRIYELQGGEILRAGSYGELFGDPNHDAGSPPVAVPTK